MGLPYFWIDFEMSLFRDGVDHESNILAPLFQSTRESEMGNHISSVVSIKCTTDETDKEFGMNHFYLTETDSSEYLLEIFQWIETEGDEPRNFQKRRYCFKYY